MTRHRKFIISISHGPGDGRGPLISRNVLEALKATSCRSPNSAGLQLESSAGRIAESPLDRRLNQAKPGSGFALDELSGNNCIIPVPVDSTATQSS